MLNSVFDATNKLIKWLHGDTGNQSATLSGVPLGLTTGGEVGLKAIIIAGGGTGGGGSGGSTDITTLAKDATLRDGSNKVALVAGANAATIKGGSAAPVAGDSALVVVISPNTPALPVSGTVTANAGTGTFTVGGTVTANAGTGTFNVAAASLPLPTGAATAARQPAIGAPGTPSTDVLTVQGSAAGTALKTDGSGSTQPISAVALPLPTGAATSTKQPAFGTVAAPSVDVLTVQVAATAPAVKTDGSGTVQPVSATALPLPTGASTAARQPNLVNGGAMTNVASFTSGTGTTFTVSAVSNTAAFTVPAGTQSLTVINGAGGTGVAWIPQFSTDGGTTWTGLSLRRRDLATSGISATGSGAVTGQAIFDVDVSGLDAFLFRLSITAVTGSLMIYVTAQSTPSSIVATNSTAIGTTATNVSLIGGSTVVNAGVTGVQAVGGNTAIGAAATSNPLGVGGRVMSTLSALLANATVFALGGTSAGQAIIKPYGSSENDWSYAAATGGITTTGAVTLKAAGATGIRNYITSLTLQNSSMTTTEVVILDGSTVLARYNVGGSTAGIAMLSVEFPVPLRGSAATVMSVQCGTSGAAVYVNAQGYQSV